MYIPLDHNGTNECESNTSLNIGDTYWQERNSCRLLSWFINSDLMADIASWIISSNEIRRLSSLLLLTNWVSSALDLFTTGKVSMNSLNLFLYVHRQRTTLFLNLNVLSLPWYDSRPGSQGWWQRPDMQIIYNCSNRIDDNRQFVSFFWRIVVNKLAFRDVFSGRPLLRILLALTRCQKYIFLILTFIIFFVGLLIAAASCIQTTKSII